MSRLEEMGQREELRTRRKIIAAEITSHCDSIRARSASGWGPGRHRR